MTETRLFVWEKNLLRKNMFTVMSLPLSTDICHKDLMHVVFGIKNPNGSQQRKSFSVKPPEYVLNFTVLCSRFVVKT